MSARLLETCNQQCKATRSDAQQIRAKAGHSLFGLLLATVCCLASACAGETDDQLRKRVVEVNQNIKEDAISFHPDFKSYLLTGYDIAEYYDWDLYFESIYLSYFGKSEYVFSNLEAFLSLQHSDGFIPRSFGVKNYGAKEMFKPFLIQLVLLGSKQKSDFSWAKDNYSSLQAYLDKWLEYDTDGNGLMYWGEFGTGAFGSYHSGMDNQFTRTLGRSEGVDLNSYLVREFRAMALIARQLDRNDDATAYLSLADETANSINQHLWDNATGFYYDRDEVSGELTTVRSVSAFTTLWAKVANESQAKILIERHLLDPDAFWTDYPVPSYALSESDYYQGSTSGESNWRGPAWMPTNYIVIHGLTYYGYDNLANEIAEKSHDMVLHKNDTLREFYDAETGGGYGVDPFNGWSSLGLFILLEREKNYDPTRLTINDDIFPLALQQGLAF